MDLAHDAAVWNNDLGISKNLSVIHNARRTVIEMLKYRKFTVVENEWDADLASFSTVFNSAPEMHTMTMRAHKGRALLLVFFPQETKLNVPSLRTMVEYAQSAESSHFIIVYRDKITTFAKNYISNYRAENSVHVECFHVMSLQKNILNHALVPRHRLLNSSEERELFKRMKTKKENFPTILVGGVNADPVAKYLGIRVGQVVEITRNHPNGFQYLFYRVGRRAITR